MELSDCRVYSAGIERRRAFAAAYRQLPASKSRWCMRLSLVSGVAIALAFSGCALSVGASLSGCIADADKVSAAAPPLSYSDKDPMTGLSAVETERSAIRAGLGRRDDLVRACMQARGFAYDAEGYSRSRPPGSKRVIDYLDGRYWQRR
jgi:hypothetical protein